MNDDYYAQARQLAEALQDEGLNKWAREILSSLEEGATATEILMSLRWKLSNFLSAPSGSEEVVAGATRLYQKIDAALS
jgi:hypothetical protein